MQTGFAPINGPTVGDEAQMPFGGTAAVEACTERRWIAIADQHYLI